MRFAVKISIYYMSNLSKRVIPLQKGEWHKTFVWICYFTMTFKQPPSIGKKKKGCSLVIYSPWSVILLYLSTVWLAVILTDILYKGTLLKWIYHKCGFLQDKGKRSKLRNHILKQNELHRPLYHFCLTCNVDPVFRVLLVGPREYASMHWHQVACIY